MTAYKYLHAEPPHRLTFGLTRHRLAGVQEAAIDRADYRTLYTRDGLKVTTAEFTLRNSRKQFLKLRLPKGASVWSAFVDGKAEKPPPIRELVRVPWTRMGGRSRSAEDGEVFFDVDARPAKGGKA